MMMDGKKSLFKKPKKRKLTQKRTQSSDDEDDNKILTSSADETQTNATSKEEDNKSEEKDSALGKIQALKKARKIKSLLKISTLEKSQKKTLVGAAENEKEDKVIIQANQDLRQKLEGTFEVRTGNAVENENSVMTLKHQMAMQEYIDAQMKKGEVPNASTYTHTDQVDQEDVSIVKDKKDLYAKILREATLIGSGMNEEKQVDEDMGAGGEMLGGTGIAEVELPVEQRLQTAKETALAASRLGMKAAASGYTSSNARETDRITQQELAKMLPTSFVSGKRKSHVSKANVLASKESYSKSVNIQPKVHVPLNKDVAFPESQEVNLDGIGSSYAHNFRLHNKEWIQKKKEETHQESNKDSASGEQEEVADGDRIGFDAKRGKTAMYGHGDDQRNAHRSRDHATYKNFISRELKHSKR